MCGGGLCGHQWGSSVRSDCVMRHSQLEPNWLGTAGVARLSLRVVNYQFPGSARVDRYDDWLVIEGIVEDGDDRWAFRDPCMLAEELEELIAWLQALPGAAVEKVRFTESAISFEHKVEQLWAVNCTLRSWAIPSEIDEFNEVWMLGRTVGLLSSENGRDRFVSGLRADLARFPRRWKP